MTTSSACFSHLYQEINRTILNSPERERGTAPGETDAWLKENAVILSDFNDNLNNLAPSLEAQSVELVRDDAAVFFCANQSLLRYLQLIEDLIRKHFPTVQKISFSLDYDPETCNEWVNADIQITGDIGQVIDWEDAFIKEWVSEVPYPERDKIRLSSDIM